MQRVPILYLIFNRLDLVEITFQRIREVKPKYLYIAADGHRKNNNSDRIDCKECRDYVLSNIDWDCNVKTLFRDKNLGCKYAVSSAIDWFFENVEMGIILEDDILPDLSFFQFCDKMLSKYRTDQRVMHIAGFNYKGKHKASIDSYFFSVLGSIWGWATWRRAWKVYDRDIKFYANSYYKNNLLEYFYPICKEKRENLYNELFKGNINSWAYQWTCCKIINNGLSITPKYNLIKNIGFNNPKSTHTKSIDPYSKINTYSINDKLIHPEYITNDRLFDLEYLNSLNAGAQSNKFKKKIRCLIKKILK